jgi:RNase P/RNase MRP subunit p30
MNAEIAKVKIQNDQILSSKEAQLKNNKKKLKSSIEEVFGKGKRLPVFSVITVDSNDSSTRKVAKNKSKGNKKHHKF